MKNYIAEFVRRIVAFCCGVPSDILLGRHGESLRNIGLSQTKTKLFFDTPEDLEQWGKEPDHKVPLTELGVTQAIEKGKVLSAIFAKIGFPKVCIHSGYLRAEHTSKRILHQIELRTGREIPVVENHSLREREAGITHVMLAHEVVELLKWNDRFWKCKGALLGRPLGGESMLDMIEGRLMNVFTFFKKFRGQIILVICHGRVMQALHMMINNMTISQMEEYMNEPHPKNCEVRHYRFNMWTRKYELIATY